jgi:hypothetical protein
MVDGLLGRQFCLCILSQQACIVMHCFGFRVPPIAHARHRDDDDYNIQALTASTFSTSTETLGIGTPAEVGSTRKSLYSMYLCRICSACCRSR